MKGLLYQSAVLYKGFFIGGIIIAIAGMIICPILAANALTNSFCGGMIGIALYVFPLASMLTIAEYQPREQEANMKCRFTNYVLAAGISKNCFVLTELVKNLIVSALGLAMGYLTLLITMPFTDVFITSQNFIILYLLTLFCGLVNWIAIPLIIKVKKQDTASLVLGIIISFPICFALFILPDIYPNFFNDMLALIEKPLFLLGVTGFAAAVYAIFYFIILARVKGGDVC